MRGLRRDWGLVSHDMRDDIARKCQISNDSIIGLFCGSLYSDKKLDLLVAASDLVIAKYPNFRLVVIGDGAEKDWRVGLKQDLGQVLLVQSAGSKKQQIFWYVDFCA